MGKVTGFVEVQRLKAPKRPAHERVRDWNEYERPLGEGDLRAQASRCMDCGVAFCHQGCPLGNKIPEWNDLVYRGRFRDAIDALHATNNFPEFTGRVCPAPCEEACVLALSNAAVTIKQVEEQIVDRAFREGWIVARPAERSTGKRVAVVGSGPAGLACAQQLARVGHAVTVYERADQIGGLLRYGIPDFKLEKWRIDRRVAQLRDEGVRFVTGVSVGRDVPLAALREESDAVCLAVGATRHREIEIPGRSLRGVHPAMEYLEQCNRASGAATYVPTIDAKGKRVVILGGGDTGADCLGSALRQGALSVHQLELANKAPDARTAEMPWPWWPMIFRSAAAHEEGGVRAFAMRTTELVGRDGALVALRGVEGEGAAFEIEADLLLLAMGFIGPEPEGLFAVNERDVAAVDAGYQTANAGVFACGDARRGASLVVWAIREGRECAREIDVFLQGESALPRGGESVIAP